MKFEPGDLVVVDIPHDTRWHGLMGIVQGLSQLQGMRLPNYYVTFVKTGNRMIVNEDELKKVEE
jgi:hypothetical protein